MYLLRIAFRNLFRRRRRTMIISVILIITATFFLIYESFLFGLFGLAMDNTLEVKTPDIEFAREEYLKAAEDEDKDLPLEELFVPAEEMRADFEEVEGLAARTEVLDFSAEFIAGRYEYPVLVRSVNPDTFAEVFRNEEFLEKGEFVESGDDGVVIGDRLAEFFQLEVGDFYTLRFQDTYGSFNTMEGEVKGIISTPDPDINSRTVFASRDMVTAPLGVDENKISQVMLRLEDRDEAPREASLLSEYYQDDNFTARSYREMEELIVSGQQWNTIQFYVMLGFFLLVGIIGVFSSVVLGAIERVEEIGMMKALGLKNSEIVRVFVLEAACLGLLGSIIGCMLGLIGLLFFNNYGLSLAAMGFEDLGFFAFEGARLYGDINPSSFPLVIVIVVAAAVLASIIPAIWAARKDPASAIHHK